ncbi:TY-Chap domain-containing protein [Aestuariimicrobium sp. T2.26MG-19.2B]|uniref:TY-Chap domain-containing protein n=1 Tax=Aestuariimicrobium sp. T2.26MG-19.2B TaxID=3040679 RepID=UPI002477315C|nr:hypothetical protein [Aestuariimicrobium sp. T2.26MG-19.2B]CAI9410647.1 hypothetical protein AESSP_02482 [Aestuariimicrobium sp. T2.26MG-19.2B]
MNADFFDLDAATDEAFDEFAELLEVSLETLELESKVTIRQLAGHRSQKLMEVTKTATGLTVLALDNKLLPASRRLTPAGMAHLRALGFQHLRQLPGYYVRVFALSNGTRAADHVCSALRESYGLLHPALLAQPLIQSRAVEPFDAPALPREADDEVEIVDRYHLDMLIECAFDFKGEAFHRSPDGWVQGMWGSVPVSVRPSDDLGRVVLRSTVLAHLVDPGRAAIAVERLNASAWPFDYSVVDDRICLQAVIAATPFSVGRLVETLHDLTAEARASRSTAKRCLAQEPPVLPRPTDGDDFTTGRFS